MKHCIVLVNLEGTRESAYLCQVILYLFCLARDDFWLNTQYSFFFFGLWSDFNKLMIFDQ